MSDYRWRSPGASDAFWLAPPALSLFCCVPHYAGGPYVTIMSVTNTCPPTSLFTGIIAKALHRLRFGENPLTTSAYSSYFGFSLSFATPYSITNYPRCLNHCFIGHIGLFHRLLIQCTTIVMASTITSVLPSINCYPSVQASGSENNHLAYANTAASFIVSMRYRC